MSSRLGRPNFGSRLLDDLKAPVLPSDDEADALTEEEVNALLKQMEDAETAANGLDDKLDTLLSKLDGMLEALGGIEGADEEEEDGREASTEVVSTEEKVVDVVEEEPEKVVVVLEEEEQVVER
ncbi:fumble-domain-containing protein [Pseudohyphozyma bogoriensis]|nr:fumble-domain-containing protein [Pseudohyphozyma bogoriensis]